MKKWFNELYKRVIILSQNVNYIKAEDAERELEKCYSFLQQIFEHSRLQDVNLFDYHYEIEVIQVKLKEIQEVIERKKNNWWKRVLKAIVKVIDFIGGYFGFGNLGGSLGYDDGPKLLDF